MDRDTGCLRKAAFGKMIVTLGAQSERLVRVASLKTLKGRRLQRRYVFEGATLLAEALGANVAIEEFYVTQAALDNTAVAAQLAARVPTYVVTERSFAKLSDVETHSGLLAVAPAALSGVEKLLAQDGTALILADLNDPGNAGTLLRSAEAFGARGVVFGAAGIDPFSPKVVRGAMGAFFRLGVAVSDPQSFAAVAAAAGFHSVGLEAGAPPLNEVTWGPREAIIVGHERRGLSDWRAACSQLAGIPIAAAAESLNAAVAGSIALYQAAGKRA